MSLLIGFLLVLGTFGAAVLDRISLGAFIVQIVIGLFLMFNGWARSQAKNEECPY